jgi:soluble lytic murein transglycosylase-like protein
MLRIPNGKYLPLQVTVVASLLFLIPSFKWPLPSAQGLDLIEASTSVPGFREEDLQEAVLAEIIDEYRTHLPAESQHRLPRQILAAAKTYGFDPYFVAGLIEIESGFNNGAVSSAGARGLLQLTPATAAALAAELGIEWNGTATLHDPAINLELGLYYLQKLEGRFGSLEMALAAYNMGPSLLNQKLATGFRPLGLYARKVNTAYRDYTERADLLRTRVVASVTL